MRKLHILALAALLPLAACGRNDPPPAASSTDAATAPPASTVLGRKIQEATAKAGEKLATENITVGGNIGYGIHYGGKQGDGNLSKAEITPQGDLLVDGKPVPVDAAQRKLLLAHRANLIAIAQAGIAIGMQGADLGVKAATGALKSVFAGNTDEFEKRMEAEGKRIQAEADKLCQRMPALLASQQALAAALPEFRPYATMGQSDVDDCGEDGDFDSGSDGASTTAAADASESDGHALDAAAEADAAARGTAAKRQ